MIINSKKVIAFPDLEKALKSVPRSDGIKSILVFNNQGLPVFKYGFEDQNSEEMDAKESAIGVEVVRSLLRNAKTLRDAFLHRIMFFYQGEMISFEKHPPFTFFITWTPDAFKTSSGNEIYIQRLVKTLLEELT